MQEVALDFYARDVLPDQCLETRGKTHTHDAYNHNSRQLLERRALNLPNL